MSLITGVDHIGILVPDLERAIAFYRDVLGLEVSPIEDRDAPRIRRACVRVGDVDLELIEARDPEQTMMRYLPHREAGIYHVGLRVADVDSAAAEMRRQGVSLVGDVREGEDMRIQYLHPDAASGTLIELVTRKRSS
jgi:methylmalonyl-CoA/ethylmalonyl-CoA epimerase